MYNTRVRTNTNETYGIKVIVVKTFLHINIYTYIFTNIILDSNSSDARYREG